MSKLLAWIRTFHFHEWKVTKEIEWFYKKETLDSIIDEEPYLGKIEECQVGGDKKHTLFDI